MFVIKKEFPAYPALTIMKTKLWLGEPWSHYINFNNNCATAGLWILSDPRLVWTPAIYEADRDLFAPIIV